MNHLDNVAILENNAIFQSTVRYVRLFPLWEKACHRIGTDETKYEGGNLFPPCFPKGVDLEQKRTLIFDFP